MSAADRFVEEATHAATALSAAHTILAGLSQGYYGGKAVLNPQILARALSVLRETAAMVELTLHVVRRRVDHAAGNASAPADICQCTAALTTDLAEATKAARAATRVLRRLETQAADLTSAAAGTDVAL